MSRTIWLPSAKSSSLLYNFKNDVKNTKKNKNFQKFFERVAKISIVLRVYVCSTKTQTSQMDHKSNCVLHEI